MYNHIIVAVDDSSTAAIGLDKAEIGVEAYPEFAAN